MNQIIINQYLNLTKFDVILFNLNFYEKIILLNFIDM